MRANKGERLRAAAVQMAYEQGLERLTLANVAAAAEMPLGSLYYYFKTRDDVAEAVATDLSGQFLDRKADWDAAGSPAAALKGFARMSIALEGQLARYGCPVGTLLAQTGKLAEPTETRAGQVLVELTGWAATQFAALGLAKDAAQAEARRMLRGLEGAAMMAHATGDTLHVREAVTEIEARIDALAPEQAEISGEDA
ncbi:TetR/AcrR family transcriptional regulator [Devosia sp.]|uniref:TetR/AcrR family transcriptional regulator n=1 Tax=Devosia sp. TaxID=1871048 RepID=UPI003A91FC9E